MLNNRVMSLNGKFVLIIDDDQAMLRALTKVLAGEGGVITSASWAGDAMEHLTDRFERYDLVITDLRMPILGGETILRAVKAALPRIPVIVITAFGNPEVRTDCLRNGAAAFLEKPLETPELLQAVSRALAPCETNHLRRTGNKRRAHEVPASEDRPNNGASEKGV